MASARKLRRSKQKAAKSGEASMEHHGRGRHRFRRTDLQEMVISAESEDLSVEALVPVGDGEGYAKFEQVFDLTSDGTPADVRNAAINLSRAIVRAMNIPTQSRQDFPCATCTSKCCGRTFEAVRVTEDCVSRMEEGGCDIGATIDFYDIETWDGYVGEFRQVPYEGHSESEEAETACPHLGPDGCGIYENRPLVCREFSAWGCELHEEDPAKVDGRVHLRVT